MRNGGWLGRRHALDRMLGGDIMADKVHAFLYKKTGLQQSKGGNNILVDVLVCFEAIVSRERDSYHGGMIAARHDP